MKHKIGDVVAEFESGRAGVASISSGRGDPGGKSYGKYQLSSKMDTLEAWLRTSAYRDEFKGQRIAGTLFDKTWKRLAREQPEEFEYDQWKFIKRTHYDRVRAVADVYGFPSLPGINEYLWSSSVQHSLKGNRKMLSRVSPHGTERQILHNLFNSRKRYVRRIRLPEATKRSVLNRYEREEAKIARELIRESD